MKKRSSKIHCSGEQVIKLRTQQSMTQEKLAAMSNVNMRTVQRAEKGEYLQLETLANLAAALKVTVSALTADDGAEEEGVVGDQERNAVVLRRVQSGKMLLDIICDSYSGKVLCQVEPTAENIEMLSAMVEKIEGFIPNPWESPMEKKEMSLADRLRTAVLLSAHLVELASFKVAVFAGTYTVMTKVPRYDHDDGHMYTTSNQRHEPVTVCRIMLDGLEHDRVIVKVNDKWTEPEPASADANLVTDDEIPF